MDPDTTLERLNYFQGQLLSVSDLTAEQDYFLAKHRRHNRYLHGWGVVSGLKVTMPDSSEIVVEPGAAIDCAGNEIHVGAQLRLKIPKSPGCALRSSSIYRDQDFPSTERLSFRTHNSPGTNVHEDQRGISHRHRRR